MKSQRRNRDLIPEIQTKRSLYHLLLSFHFPIPAPLIFPSCFLPFRCPSFRTNRGLYCILDKKIALLVGDCMVSCEMIFITDKTLHINKWYAFWSTRQLTRETFQRLDRFLDGLSHVSHLPIVQKWIQSRIKQEKSICCIPSEDKRWRVQSSGTKYSCDYTKWNITSPECYLHPQCAGYCPPVTCSVQ